MSTPTKGWFITGTDTDVGKTLISAAFVDWLAQQDTACGYKPVAAGCNMVDDQLLNDDALALQAASLPKPSYSEINPIALERAIAPHIAAAETATTINLSDLVDKARHLENKHRFVVIEGAGGWLVPLNDQHSFADLAAELNHPVILVVAMRLGCINHALLTANAIKNSGLELAGWIANCLDPEMPALTENINSVKLRLPAPLLGIVPKLDKPDTKAIQQHIGFQTLVT